MSALRVYRIVVESWPTPDGEPWKRIYGSPHGETYDHLNGFDESRCGPDIPDWLSEQIRWAQTQGPCRNVTLTPYAAPWRVLDRLVEDTDRDVLMGVVMPKPNRKHYLSAAGAHELVRDMRAFGAVARVERSQPVEWATA